MWSPVNLYFSTFLKELHAQGLGGCLCLLSRCAICTKEQWSSAIINTQMLFLQPSPGVGGPPHWEPGRRRITEEASELWADPFLHSPFLPGRCPCLTLVVELHKTFPNLRSFTRSLSFLWSLHLPLKCTCPRIFTYPCKSTEVALCEYMVLLYINCIDINVVLFIIFHSTTDFQDVHR